MAELVARGEPIVEHLRSDKVNLTETDVFSVVPGWAR
jgi:hypothetical protein